MRIDELEWDDENVEHVARHNVSPEEVEEVCFGPHVAFLARNRRYVLYGQADNGRYLKVVLERLSGATFRPVTALDMAEREKQAYRRGMR